MNLLVVDNFDSFTYLLTDYLQQAGADCRVLRNNEPTRQLLHQAVDGVVLSPGPGTPRLAGRLMDVVTHYPRRVPMLGVCLGHQALGESFGARLTAADRPMHGIVSAIDVVADDPLFAGLPDRFSVTRYHSLRLTDLPKSLTATALTDAGEAMALRHRSLPLWDMQFHPKATLTEYGLPLLKNWINTTKNKPIPVDDFDQIGLSV